MRAGQEESQEEPAAPVAVASIPACNCPPGAKGDKGDRGETVIGPQGPAGRPGKDGKDGRDARHFFFIGIGAMGLYSVPGHTYAWAVGPALILYFRPTDRWEVKVPDHTTRSSMGRPRPKSA